MSEYEPDQLDALLGRSVIRRRILSEIVLEPERRLHLRELARRSMTSAGTARRELQRLEAAGLVERQREGNQVYYRMPSDSPIARSVAGIVRQTAGARAILRHLLRDLDAVESVVIFGSYAAGMTNPTSDIDILVVGTPDRDVLTDRLERAGRAIGRPVNEVVFTPEQLQARRDRGDSFVQSIDIGATIAVLP